METENIISELYYGNIRPVEQMGESPPEAKDILRRLHENEDKLEGSLNEQENALLILFRMTGLSCRYHSGKAFP